MPIERNNIEERRVRLDLMVAELQAERRRRLVTQATALWNRTESDLQAVAKATTPRITIH